MPYTPTTWVDELPATTPVKYVIKDNAGNVLYTNVTIDVVSSITTPGTQLNAANMNHIETAVSAHDTAIAASAPAIFSAIGDLLYASGIGAAARLPIGASGKILTVASGLPSWGVALNPVTVAKNSVDISTNTSSTTYVDVVNATVTMVLANTCTLILLGSACLTSASGATETIQGSIDGNLGLESITVLSAGQVLTWNYVQIKTNVAAGSRTIKLQYKTSANTSNIYNGSIFVIAIPTA